MKTFSSYSSRLPLSLCGSSNHSGGSSSTPWRPPQGPRPTHLQCSACCCATASHPYVPRVRDACYSVRGTYLLTGVLHDCIRKWVLTPFSNQFKQVCVYPSSAHAFKCAGILSNTVCHVEVCEYYHTTAKADFTASKYEWPSIQLAHWMYSSSKDIY